MALGAIWRNNPEKICRNLERFENTFKKLNTNFYSDDDGELTNKLISKMVKIRESLMKEGLAVCSLGHFRKAAEQYDRVLQIAKQNKQQSNKSQAAQKITFPYPIKKEIVAHITHEIQHDFQFKTLSCEERNLVLCLAQNTEKKLAHLFGNKIALGKKDSFGILLEGMENLSSLTLFLTLILGAEAKHPHIFSSTHEGWKTIQDVFSKAYRYAILFARVQNKPVLERKQIHERITETILKDLNALSESEQIGIPWGWIANDSGHAMFLVITKKSPGYLLDLYNTGDGKQYQPCLAIADVLTWVNRITYKVSEHQVIGFKTFLHHIIETVIYGNLSEKFPKPHLNPFLNYSGRYKAEDLYTYLNQYERITKEVTKDDWWSQGNISGICEFKSLYSAFGYSAPDLLDPFKVFYSSEVLRLLFLFDKYFIAPNQTVQMILSHAIPNLARHLNKPAQVPHSTFVTIDKLEGWNRHLQSMLISTQNSNPTLEPPEQLNSLSPAIAQICQQALDLKEPAITPKAKNIDSKEFTTPPLYAAPTPPKWDAINPIHAVGYIKWLEDVNTYAKKCVECNPYAEFNRPALLVDTLFRENYQPFLDPDLDVQKQVLLKQLLEKPPLTAAVMQNLLESLKIMGQITNVIYPHADSFLVAHGMYCVLIEMARLCDQQQGLTGNQRLDWYGLDSPFWDTFKTLRLTNMRFYDLTLTRDLQWISQSITEKKNNNPTFFTHIIYESSSPTYGLIPNSAEVAYSKAHRQLLPSLEQDNALEAYEEEIIRTKDLWRDLPNPDFERWLLAWIFSNGKTCLPEQFSILLNGIFFLSHLVPWKGGGFQEIALGKPRFDCFWNNGSEECVQIPLQMQRRFEQSIPNKVLDYPFNKNGSRFSGFQDWSDQTYYPVHEIIEENRISLDFQASIRMPQLAAASNHPIRLLTLVDAYLNFEKLENQLHNHKEWISDVLLSPEGLFDALKKAPHLSKEFTNFFEASLDHYILGTCHNISKTETQDFIAFIYHHYLSFLLIERELSNSHNNNKIVDLRQRILKHVQSSEEVSHSSTYGLWNTFVQSFSGPEDLSQEDFLHIVQGLFEMRKKLHFRKNFNTPEGIFAVYNHMHRINQLIHEKDTTDKLLGILLKEEGIAEAPYESSFIHFPLASVKTEKAAYLFDLLEGRLVHTTLQKVYSNENDGTRFSEAQLPEALKPFYSSKAMLWVPRDKQVDECEISECTPRTPIKTIKRNGLFHFRHMPGEWELLQEPKVKHPFFRLNAPAIWAKSMDEDKNVCVVFPHLKMEGEGFFTLMFKKDKWHVHGKSAWVLDDCQKVERVDLFGNFLLVANDSNQQRILVPYMNSEGLAEGKNDEKEKIILISLEVKDHRIVIQETALKNIYASYLLYKHAKFPTDFLHAFEYLKAAKVLRKYTEKEIEAFRLITSVKDQDHSPQAIAFRLNAMLILIEHSSLFDNWEPYNGQEKELLYKQYLSKYNDIAEGLRIENNFPHELIRTWLDSRYPITAYQYHQLPKSKENISSISTIGKYYSGCVYTPNPSKDFPLICTKTNGEFSKRFDFLLKSVKTAIGEKRIALEQKLRFAYLGSDDYDRTPLIILFMELYATDPSSSLHKLALECKTVIDAHMPKENSWQASKEAPLDSFIVQLNNYLNGIDHSSISFKGPLPRKKSTEEIFYEKTPFLNFIPNKNLFSMHSRHFDELFRPPETDEILALPTLFTAPKNMPLEVAARIQSLNRETAIGVRKNCSYRKMLLRKDTETTKHLLTTTVKASLLDHLQEDRIQLQNLATQIELMGNHELVNNPKFRAEVLGFRKKKLALTDLVVLFLQHDPRKIEKATGIQSLDTQSALLKHIGSYLELWIRSKHTQVCLEAISDLENLRENDLTEALQNAGYLLSYTDCTINAPNVLIQLALQWACGFIARPNQRDILQQVFKDGTLQNLIKQVLQADGKTYVLGPFLALLGADGKHLSVHVDPKYQYETTLSTLGTQVQKTIGKLLYTFVYEDSCYQDAAYLMQAYKRLKAAIKERIPIATTQDSLRVLRSRYIEASIRRHSLKETDLELEHTVKAMRKIMRLFRLKGLFMPLEEVHEGTNPTKIHNIPSGPPYHFDEDELFIVLELLITAANAKDENGAPLLNLMANRQAQQTPQQKDKMLRILADWCMNNERWRMLADIDTPDETLTQYLYIKEAPTPEAIKRRIKKFIPKPKERTSIEFLLITRQLLAGKWLETVLSKSVFEHFLIVYKEHAPSTAIPCEADMCPALNSEFSNSFMMALNTLIAGFVQGIFDKQMKDFILFTRLQAKAESHLMDIHVHDTKIYQAFGKLLNEAGLEGDLFHFSYKNREASSKLQAAMKSSNPDFMRLIGSYICQKTLMKKDFFAKEIATNGINVATMGKRVVGYSGTLDNPYTSIVMDYTGRKVEVLADEGTDGQTLDLLINRHHSVYLMGNEANNLFTDVVANLPADKCKRFRLLVDGGSHFRGIVPFVVAKEMAKWGLALKIPYKVVLSYDLETRLPFAVRCDNIDERIPVTAQRIDLIANELSVEADEIAVFLPQFKATGTDLAIKADAVGIYTVTENTPSYLIIQEVRRLRDLYGAQEAICALQQGCLSKMSAVLEKPELANMNTRGKINNEKFITDVLLFAYINRFTPLSEESYLLCVQNLKNIIMQYLLDGIFTKKFSEKTVFTKAKDLFVEDTAIDFIREIGMPKTAITQHQHLTAVADHFLKFLDCKEFVISKKVRKIIRQTMANTIASFLPALPEQIETVDASQTVSHKENGTMVQTRDQKQHQQQNVDREDIRQRMQIWSRNRGYFRSWTNQMPLEMRHLTEHEFPALQSLKFNKEGELETESENLMSGLDHFPIDNVMSTIYPNLWQAGTFGKNLIASLNWLRSIKGLINVGDIFQKPLVFVLLVEKQGNYSLAFITQENAAQLADIFEQGFQNKIGTNLWLLRANGDQAWPGPSAYNKEFLLNNKNVRMLFVQALVFSGRIDLLDRSFWQQALYEWLKTHPHPNFVTRFFEESAIRDANYDQYLLSNTRKVLRRIKQ
jgi:hypothetical protein